MTTWSTYIKAIMLFITMYKEYILMKFKFNNLTKFIIKLHNKYLNIYVYTYTYRNQYIHTYINSKLDKPECNNKH